MAILTLFLEYFLALRQELIIEISARLQYNLRRIMSKKNINASVNPLPALAKSSKKGKTKSKLEGIDDFIVNDSSIQPEQSSQQLGRLKKLRKVGDKNKEKQRIIQESQHSGASQQIQSEYEEEKQSSEIDYQRFKKVDDDDIKKIQEQGNKKKGKSKGKKQMKKGQQNLQTFIGNHPHPAEQKNKKSPFKSNKPQVQQSLMSMMALCAKPKKQEPITSSKMVDESQSKSDSDQDSLQLARKRRAMMNDQKNTGLTDEQAIKIAMMESMKDIQPQKPAQVPIDAYSYQASKTKSVDYIKPQSVKVEQKKQPTKQEKPVPQKNENRKREKSVGKKKQDKVQKSGVLSGLGIVLTGEFEPYSKNKILELLQQLGADLPKSITKKTTHLLQGAFVVNNYGRKTDQDVRTTTKSQQAAQKNIKIIPFSELDDFFVQKTGKTLEQNMENDRPPKQIDSLLDRFLQKNNQNGSACKTLAHDQITDEKQNHGEQQMNDKNKVSGISVSWTQKYKPRSSEQIIGQSSQIKMLKEWLQIWQDIHIRGNKRDVKPAFNSFMPSGTINSNAALLSGDAGLGKTTTARLIASQFGYSVIQYNASDARNKKSVQLLTLGRDNMSFMNNKSKDMAKTLIIMDQVDGMSSGDRGGIAAIISMIKSTKVPIICICNDRQSTKIRSLAGHCYDIKFHKPDKRQIAKRLQKIIQAEKGTSTSVALQAIVELLQNDIRQILTYLEVMFKSGVKNINSDVINRKCNTKDTSLTLNHFQATKNLLTRTTFKEMTILQRIDLAYVDSDMVPLMVQQNYLSSCLKKKLNLKQFKRLTKAAQSFTKADMIDRAIMRNQNYCLMPNKMFLSCIYPCEMVSENMGFPKFTQWLGKFSSQRKNKRLIKQLKYNIACATPATFYSTKFNYAPMLLQRIYQQLRVSDPDIDSIIQFMWHYSITPAILNEHICVLQYGERQNLIKSIQTSKKTKLTKTYNKKCETTKFKKQKMKVSTEHAKYDPVLDQMEEDGDQEQQDQASKGEESQVIVEKKGAKSKPKPKKK